MAGSCENINKPSGSKIGREYLDWPRDYLLLKYSAPWS
jgi:hypothetical protein